MTPSFAERKSGTMLPQSKRIETEIYAQKTLIFFTALIRACTKMYSLKANHFRVILFFYISFKPKLRKMSPFDKMFIKYKDY